MRILLGIVAAAIVWVMTASAVYHAPQLEVVVPTATPFPSITIGLPPTATVTHTHTVTPTWTQTPTWTPTPSPTNTVPTATPGGYTIEIGNIWTGEIQIQIGEEPK
jgi:hypothetical protein